MRAISIPKTFETWMLTSTKEDTMKFLGKVGERLKKIIESQINFDELLEESRKIVLERLGEMPPIENVDTDWIFGEASEVVH